MNPSIRLFFLCASVCTSAVVGTAHAAITSVTTSPNAALVALTRVTTVNVGWNAVSNSGGTVSSTQGVFRTPTSTVLGTVSHPLTRVLSGAGTATFSEAVMVPADVSMRARSLGFSHLLYERSFNDGGGAGMGSITLHLASETAATFSISRIALSFSDDTPVIIVERGAKLSAAAAVGYTGSGMVEAVWELAGPNPATEPKYRTLLVTQRALSGGDQATLKSPELPTDSTGMYLVRLNITAPKLGIEEPVIRYSVIEKKN
jgi:hypothetical protein